MISRLLNARNAYAVEDIRGNVDAYMSGCPRGYNWRGMTAEGCAQYRTFAFELANRRLREFELNTAAAEADRAFREADTAAQTAAANLAALEAQLQDTRDQRAAVSLVDPKFWMDRILTAFVSLLMTLLSVIFIVWVGSSVISLFSWLTLMMRGLEILLTQKLKNAPREEGEEAPA